MKYTTAASLLILALILVSCGSDPSAPGGRMTGKLTGSVELRTIDDKPIPDASGATVAVEGTYYRTTTASDGTWHFDGLPAGTYTLSFSKPGFASLRMLGYQFTGGGEAFISPVTLGQLSTARVTSFSAHVGSRTIRTDSGGVDTISLGGDAVIISATFSEPVRMVAAFFNSSPSIAPDSGRYRGVGFMQWPPTSVSNAMMIMTRDLEAAGYRSGDTVYMALYLIGPSSTTYYDPSLRTIIYSAAVPAVGSNVVSFTMP